MTEHLSEQQIDRYLHARMQGPELLEADRHIASCGACRERVADAVGLAEKTAAVQADLRAIADAGREHLTYEQILGYVENTLAAGERGFVTGHIEACPSCRAEAEDLRRLATAMSEQPTKEYSPKAQRSTKGDHRSRPVRQRRRYALAVSIAVVAILVVIGGVLTLGSRPGIRYVDDDTRATDMLSKVKLKAGDRVMVLVPSNDASAESPFRVAQTFTVQAGGKLPVLTVKPGLFVMEVSRGVARGRGAFRAFLRSLFGAKTIALYRFDRNLSGEDLRTLFSGAFDQAAIDRVLRSDQASINYFDDIKVYAGKKVFLDENFDSYREGQRKIDTLRPYWGGKDGYVTHRIHAPGSAPGCWASEAYPAWNRGDMIGLRPEDVPRGEDLTFEASIYIPNAEKGVGIGLVRPFTDTNELGEQYSLLQCPVQINFRAGRVWLEDKVGGYSSAGRPPDSFKGTFLFKEGRWHRLKVVVHGINDPRADSYRLDICLDGTWVRNVSSPKGEGLLFDHFAISGTQFAHIIDD